MNTTWYLHSHLLWLRLSYSSIRGTPFRVLGGSQLGVSALDSFRCQTSTASPVVVVFLDLRGFTAFAETTEPEKIMGVLREYHAEMGRVILTHEGTLERFAGDGMMVFFNDPVQVDDPAARAVRMTVMMRERLSELT